MNTHDSASNNLHRAALTAHHERKNTGTASAVAVSDAEHFRNGVALVFEQFAEDERTRGTVSMSLDCIWQNLAHRIGRVHGAPVGTNAAYFAKQVLAEVAHGSPFLMVEGGRR